MFCNFDIKINLKQIEKSLFCIYFMSTFATLKVDENKCGSEALPIIPGGSKFFTLHFSLFTLHKRESATRCSWSNESNAMKNIFKYGKDYL